MLEYHQYPEVDYPPVTQLYINGTLLDENNQSFLDRVFPVLNIIPLMSLDILVDQMSIDMFVEILDCLPNLRSIRLQKISFAQLKKMSFSHRKIWKRFLKKNQIEKITLRLFFDLLDVIHLRGLFPRITSLSLQYLFDDDLQIFIGTILHQREKSLICRLQTLCFETIELKSDSIDKLKQFIDDVELAWCCSIHRQLNRIYFIFR